MGNGGAVGFDEPQVFAPRRERKAGMQLAIGRRHADPGGKHDQTLRRVERNGRKGPFVEIGAVVGQMPAGQIGGFVASVVELDPVRFVAVVVLQTAGVRGHDLAENDVGGQQLPGFQRLQTGPICRAAPPRCLSRKPASAAAQPMHARLACSRMQILKHPPAGRTLMGATLKLIKDYAQHKDSKPCEKLLAYDTGDLTRCRLRQFPESSCSRLPASFGESRLKSTNPGHCFI